MWRLQCNGCSLSVLSDLSALSALSALMTAAQRGVARGVLSRVIFADSIAAIRETHRPVSASCKHLLFSNTCMLDGDANHRVSASLT